jgi:hypothetical protein
VKLLEANSITKFEQVFAESNNRHNTAPYNRATYNAEVYAIAREVYAVFGAGCQEM